MISPNHVPMRLNAPEAVQGAVKGLVVAAAARNREADLRGWQPTRPD
jgi:hypothetical protein